jgi:hypothetical protein
MPGITQLICNQKPNKSELDCFGSFDYIVYDIRIGKLINLSIEANN